MRFALPYKKLWTQITFFGLLTSDFRSANSANCLLHISFLQICQGLAVECINVVERKRAEQRRVTASMALIFWEPECCFFRILSLWQVYANIMREPNSEQVDIQV